MAFTAGTVADFYWVTKGLAQALIFGPLGFVNDHRNDSLNTLSWDCFGDK
jgi:hypothetical protein